MADTTSIQIIQDGGRQAIIKTTTAVGNTDVVTSTLVDVSTLAANPANNAACTGVTLLGLTYLSVGVAVKLEWDADTNVSIFEFPVDWADEYDFSAYGLPNNSGAGKTGDIVATTISPTGGDFYTFIFILQKLYA